MGILQTYEDFDNSSQNKDVINDKNSNRFNTLFALGAGIGMGGLATYLAMPKPGEIKPTTIPNEQNNEKKFNEDINQKDSSKEGHINVGQSKNEVINGKYNNELSKEECDKKNEVMTNQITLQTKITNFEYIGLKYESKSDIVDGSQNKTSNNDDNLLQIELDMMSKLFKLLQSNEINCDIIYNVYQQFDIHAIGYCIKESALYDMITKSIKDLQDIDRAYYEDKINETEKAASYKKVIIKTIEGIIDTKK